MKLYNRGQAVILTVICVLILLTVLVGTGRVRLFRNTATRTDSPIVAPDNPASPPTRATTKPDMGAPVELNVTSSTEINPTPPKRAYGQDELINISVYRAVNRAVVYISTEVIAFDFFADPAPSNGASGSGSIIDNRGYVLTNYHVVKGAYKVHVALYDGSQHEGRVIGADMENDLALVKFDPPSGATLPIIDLGDSSNLEVGQKVLAIGNPFAFERTLTTGIISGLGRPLRSETGIIIQNMIQTDASINPGNSGGPLLDGSGKIIGVNTMIYSPSGGSVGIGFAVPVDTAKRVILDLMKYGEVRRGQLDASLFPLFPRLARYAGINADQGMLVSSVTSGGLAAKAGLRGGSNSKVVNVSGRPVYLGGDIIVAINGKATRDSAGYLAALENSKPGDTVELTVLRGSSTVKISVPLVARPKTGGGN